VGSNTTDKISDTHRKAPNAELEGRKHTDLSKEGEIHMQKEFEGNLKSLMDICTVPSSSRKDGSDMTSNHFPKPSRSKKFARTKNTQDFKRSSSSSVSKATPFLRATKSISRPEDGTFLTSTNGSPSFRMGNMAQQSDNTNLKRNNCTNLSLPPLLT